MASTTTRGQFITRVLDACGRPLTGTTLSGVTYPTLLASHYKIVLMRIARAYSFPEMDTYVEGVGGILAGQKVYSFADICGLGERVKDILTLVVSDGLDSRKLKRVTEREYYKRSPSPESESENKPTIYCRIGDNLHLFPIPSSDLPINVCFSRYPADALDDSSVPEFEYKDDVIHAGMMSEFLNHLQENREASRWNGVFMEGLTAAVKTVAHPTDWEVEGRGYGGAEGLKGEYWNNPFIG
jgi:hypothetical protein